MVTLADAQQIDYHIIVYLKKTLFVVKPLQNIGYTEKYTCKYISIFLRPIVAFLQYANMK